MLQKREQVYEVANKVKKEVGKVDILVNNAGIVSGKTLLEVSDESAQRTMDVNTLAHFWTVKAFLPDMIKSNDGHLVTIASAASISGVHGLADYCASKWAAYGFNESLRMEMKKQKHFGIHTTCICPYYINTGMFDGVKSKIPWLLPILDEKWVANKIINAIRENEEVIYLPRIVFLSMLIRAIFPVFIYDYLSDLLGVNDTMDDFKGRNLQYKD